MAGGLETEPGFTARWRIYFSERFPPLQHGVLIAAYVIGALAFSARLHGRPDFPGPLPLLGAFAVTFLLFLQLRILDEFKDCGDDARWRPYRPVPRGIVTLRALGRLGVGAAAVQLALALLFDPRLALPLVAIWIYAGLMGVEFFVRDWLKARPVAYMASHMVIVPMITLFITAFDWLPRGAPDGRLGWLLAMSYCGFCVIEIGRKIRAPADEEAGVETYSALWGRRGAVGAWLAAMALTGALAVGAGRVVGVPGLTAVFAALLLAAALGVGVAFLRHPRPGRGGRFQLLSGIWMLGMFLVPGLAPWLPGSGVAS
ncbi:UbiA family prenyltransferase [Thioalbus denitrificans]|uniref:4-hydroxybenzoate polyprenyltransferase n=1 Tax=Thioalbus denitrificans TaxID=547122 RepID=A0A369C8P0_9GAMM|nr:UbiA family prenyltransferase [Thioalbus denitrificans]RCX30259.1 4-hydroxybenzoate polyprenyltransferase [Thioalbus denitrificans]